MLDPVAMGLVAASPAEPEETLRIELRVISGPDRGKVHNIQGDSALVGRGLDCNIVLADPAVSRKHFRVERDGDGVDVVDMGGANGTNINGQRVQRHRLQPGDRVEIGTSVLEYHVEGAAPRRRPASGAFGDEAPVAMAGRGRQAEGPDVRKMALIAAAVLAVLLGGGVTAWLVVGGGDEPAVDETADVGNAAVTKAIDSAKGLIADEEFAEAVDALKEARKLDPRNVDIRKLLTRAQDELDAGDVIEDGRAAAKRGEFEFAIQQFKSVDKDLMQYTLAQEELQAALESFATTALAAARKAMNDGDLKVASAAVAKVLDADPKHTEAKLLKAQLDGDAGDEAAGDSPEGKKPAAKPVAVKSDAPRDRQRPAEASASSAKDVLAQGLRAYHDRKWSAAVAAFEKVAEGGYGRGDKSKAGAWVAAVKDVSSSLGSADAGGGNAAVARSLKKAYEADRRIDGHFGPTLVKRVAGAYVKVAEDRYAQKKYADAADAVREAQNFDYENAKAQSIQDKCVDKAVSMLAEAKDHMGKQNHATARDLARRVVRILPAMDPRAAEAREIAKKATMASTAGDDD